MPDSKMSFFATIFYLKVLLLVLAKCQREDFDHFESDVPSHLRSARNVDLSLLSRQDGADGGPLGTGLAGESVIPPPQNVPVDPLGPGVGPGGLPDGFVPFGLNHIILIIIPKFQAKFQKLPKWLSSTIKISMPITVFFDQLTVPPGMFVPGLAGLPLPLGIPPPIGLKPPTPVLPVSPPNPAVPPASGSTPTTNAQINPGYVYQPTYSYGAESYDNEPQQLYDDEEEEEGYDNSYSGEERKLRKKRTIFTNNTHKKSREKRAISFNETVHSTERAALLPKLETLLENGGFGGKSCLLRVICEVHEAPLDHYGLLGELFTMFFSVSRSAFAKSHLAEYLRAEEVGKSGDCTEYFSQCENTIFSWEEVKTQKKKKNRKPFVVNVIDEVL